MGDTSDGIYTKSHLTSKGWVVTITYLYSTLFPHQNLRKAVSIFWYDLFYFIFCLGKFVSCHALPTAGLIFCTIFKTAFLREKLHAVQFIHLQCTVQCASMTVHFRTFLLPPKAALLPLAVTPILRSCQQPPLYLCLCTNSPLLDISYY